MDWASRFIEIGGVKTHYIEGGSGPTLVFIHGGGAGADGEGNWKYCFPDYTRNFRVIAVDMIGFGRSGRPDPASYSYGQSNRNRHMIDFIEAVSGSEPVLLIGNSMGGATALGVTIQRSDLVRKLVLMGAAGLDIANPDTSHRSKLTGYDYTKVGMRRLVDALTGPNFEVSDAMIDYRHALTVLPDAAAATEAIKEHMREDGMIYSHEQIASIEIPTLVVGGKEDKIAVLERTYGFLRLIPNSWGFVLPHVGHWVMIEAPREFVAVTTAFFSNDMFAVTT